MIVSTNPVILRGYERDAEELEAQAKKLRNQARLGWEEIIRKALGGVHWPLSFDMGYWGWDCKDSPIGKCVYDDASDPCHDSCVFCQDPEERK